MIEALDAALRRLLVQGLPIENNEIEVAFDQPRREWSSRLSRPTLNIFLYDIRENVKLRKVDWRPVPNGNGNDHKSDTVTVRRTPLRMDLYYMITAWATEAIDEHRLLSRTLMVLAQQPYLPEEALPRALKNQPFQIPIQVAQLDILRTPTDLWSVLDNELRPALAFMITLAVNPYQPATLPLVRSRDLQVGQAWELPATQELNEAAGRDQFWSIGGRVRTEQAIEDLRLTLVDRGVDVPLLPDGRFTIHNLETGDYTLAISVAGQTPRYHKITVPATDYQLEV